MATFKNVLGNFAKQTFADATTSVISNMINNAFNRSMMKEQYELNEQAAQNAYNRQLDFWNKQNDYNDPSSQMARLRQAGLNPAIMNGNINNTAGGLSSVSSASASGQSSNRPMDRVDLLQLVSQNLQNQNLEANTQYIVQQTNRERMNNIKLAIETDDFASWYYYQKQLLIETVGEKRADRILTEHKARTEFESARQLWLNNNLLKDAIDDGVNPVIDSHNESIARVDEIRQNIKNKRTQNDIDKLNLELARLFDRQFLELDLSARQREVAEFLDTSEVRVSLYNAQKGFARLAMNEAERSDAINKIVNEYQKSIAQSILDAAKDGRTKFDGVLLDWLSKDPSSTLSALSALSSFKPNIVNNTFNK